MSKRTKAAKRAKLPLPPNTFRYGKFQLAARNLKYRPFLLESVQLYFPELPVSTLRLEYVMPDRSTKFHYFAVTKAELAALDDAIAERMMEIEFERLFV